MAGRASRLRLVAAFGAGVAAWEAIVHASLLLSGSSPRIFGIRLGRRTNLVQSVIPAATAAVLMRYVLGRPRPPVVFRVAARLLLREELGPALGRVLASADRHYATVAPKIEMAVTRAGRLELTVSAYLLALYRAIRAHGVADEEAVRMLSTGFQRVMRGVWRAADAVVPASLPSAERARIQVGLARCLAFREPDWAMHEVPSDEGFAIDVTRCVARDFFVAEGAGSLCDRVMCEQDVRMARERGVPFTRTQTLARGDARCDFRFA